MRESREALPSTSRRDALSSDPRAVRTRQAILDALSDLQSSSGRLTTGVIAHEAGISRSTFYLHFASMDDLALYVFDVALQDLANADIDRRTTSATEAGGIAKVSLTLLLDHVEEHKKLYESVFTPPVSARAYLMAVERFTEVTKRILPLTKPAPADFDLDVSRYFVSAGILRVVAAWVTGELNLTADEVAQRMLPMLPEWMN